MSSEAKSAVIVLLCAVILLWIAWQILSWIARLFVPREVAPMPDIIAAQKLLETPRPVLGTNEWVRTKCETEVCAAPMAANNIEPHFPADKAHRATCKRCQQDYARVGAIPHAN